MNKLISLALLLLIVCSANGQTESRKKFIDTVVNLLSPHYDSSYIICFKYKNRINKLMNVQCSNYYAYRIMNENRGYSKEQYKTFIKNILLHDKIIECSTLFGKIEKSKNDYIVTFERLTTDIDNSKFKIVDSIIHNNENYIDIFFKNKKQLNLDYFSLHNEIICRLWYKNIAFRNSISLGFYDGHVIKIENKDIITETPDYKDLYIKEFGLMLYTTNGHFEQPFMLVPWKLNDASFYFRVIGFKGYKGNLTFAVYKNDKKYITGKYKADNILYTKVSDSIINNKILKENIGINMKIKFPCYIPIKIGKWKYYDDNGKLIKEEDFGGTFEK